MPALAVAHGEFIEMTEHLGVVFAIWLFMKRPSLMAPLVKDTGGGRAVSAVGNGDLKPLHPVPSWSAGSKEAVMVKAALPEAEILVDARLTASFDPALHEKALDILEGLQVTVTNR